MCKDSLSRYGLRRKISIDKVLFAGIRGSKRTKRQRPQAIKAEIDRKVESNDKAFDLIKISKCSSMLQIE